MPLRYDAAGFPAAHSLHAALAGRQWLPAGRRSSIEPSEAVLVGFSKGAVVLHQVRCVSLPSVESQAPAAAAAACRSSVRLLAAPAPSQILAELAAWQDAAGERCAVCAWQEQRQQQRAAAAPSSQQDDGTGGWQAALASVAAMHWVDGGADTRGAIYPSSPSLFAALARRCALHRLHLCLHGSPRQWADPRRPWLGAEARAMAASSSAAGAPLHAWRQLFWGEAPSLQQHFATLEAFQP